MARYIQRLGVAFLISASCFGGTLYWYHQWQPESSVGHDRTPIARLQHLHNEVQRKPLTRMIWQRVSANENLFSGEILRTNADSQASIYFSGSGTLIDLEPESMIVIEESGKGIALSFLSGQMLVRHTGESEEGTPSTAMSLTSQGRELQLDRSELSIGQGQDGRVNLEVLSGQARIVENGQERAIGQNQRAYLMEENIEVEDIELTVLSPAPHQPVLLNPERPEPMRFAWRELPEGYRVYLLVGERRQNMQRQNSTATDGRLGELSFTLPTGRHFWQLEAQKIDDPNHRTQSLARPLEVIAQRPPVPIEPRNDQVISLNQIPLDLAFSWAPQARMDQLVLEVAKDPALQRDLQRSYVQPHQVTTEVNFTEPGEYYWRVTGFIQVGNDLKSLSSSIQRFTLNSEQRLSPPPLRSPASELKISESELDQTGLFFSWEPSPDVASYRIRIRDSQSRQAVVDQRIPQPPFQTKTLVPGNYEWAVISLNSEGQAISDPSEVRRFEVLPIQSIQWSQDLSPEQQFYLGQKPEISLGWEPGELALGSPQYRVWLRPHSSAGGPQSPGQLLQRSVQSHSLTTEVPHEGHYETWIEALDPETSQVLGRSSIRRIQVSARPRLQAPRFAQDLPVRLRADRQGNLELRWNEVRGAKAYQLQVVDSSTGQTVVSRSPQSQSTQLTRLRPGEYEVRLLSVDEYDRVSSEYESRFLEVPRNSDIQAPRVKRIEVQ